ncbi:hypothetical protein Tco_0283204 [Tanacetum coccineum]
MVKMVPYEAFACPCGSGDVVLRESYKPKTREERVRLLVGSPGASTTPIHSPGSSSTPIYSPGAVTIEEGRKTKTIQQKPWKLGMGKAGVKDKAKSKAKRPEKSKSKSNSTKNNSQYRSRN